MGIFKTVGRAVHDSFHDYDVERMHGVTVIHDADYDHLWDEWESVLNEHLPTFDEHGWLDGLERIKVGSSWLSEEYNGKYASGWGTIILADEVYAIQGATDNLSKRENVLVHEMIHHVHMRDELDAPDVSNEDVHQYQQRVGFDRLAPQFEEAVSDYAAENFLEAVAETGVLLAAGEDIDPDIRSSYDLLGGPEIPFTIN